MAVRNAQLYDQTIERFAALETLHQMSLDLATVQKPGEIAQRVTQAALDLLKPSAVWLCLCDDLQEEAQFSPQPNEIRVWTAYASGDPSQPRVESQPVARLHALITQVRETGQSVLIMDMANEPVLQREFETPWLVQAASIYPIQSGDQLFAVMALLYAEPTFFRQDMLRTLDLLALEAATALQNARYLATLRRQLSEVTTLQDLARRVSELRSLDAVLHNVVHTLQDIYQCKSVWVALLDKDRTMVSIRAATGMKLEYAEQLHFPVGEHVAGRVVETGEPVYVLDTHREPRFRIIDPSVRSMMVVPLTVHGRVLGALGMDSIMPNAFVEGHKRILNIAGGQIAATIETIHLLRQTQERAEDLSAANEILKEQDKLRQELVHQVSHDLRSPLQLVYGYADMLHGGFLGDVTSSQMDILKLMMKRIKAIELMTRDIMASKSISTEILELEQIELNAMCQQAIVDIRLLNQGRPDLHFETALNPGNLVVEADPVRLRRVFDNLLVNAVKFHRTAADHAAHRSDPKTGRAIIDQRRDRNSRGQTPLIFESFSRWNRKIRGQRAAVHCEADRRSA
jgi:GAF domain-containing protein